MTKIRRKGLIFFTFITLYILVTVVLKLYKYDLILLSYFFILVIWIFAFSKNPLEPYFGGPALSGMSIFINRLFGKKLMPWVEFPHRTRFTLNDLVRALFFFVSSYLLFLFVLGCYGYVINRSLDIDLFSPGFLLTSLFLTLSFWFILLLIKAILQSLTKDWS